MRLGHDLGLMNRDLAIQARWDDQAGVWLATSRDVPGLVVETETWPRMIEEVGLILLDLLELAGQDSGEVSLTSKEGAGTTVWLTFPVNGPPIA